MGSSEGQTYCLRWNNHKSNLVEILDILIKMEYYVDCTIVVDEQVTFKAHRVILAANSPYFQAILMDVPMDHCSILFPGVKEFEMRALLEYMYTGEVNVTQAQIPRIMRVAEQLEVKGLFDMSELRRSAAGAGGAAGASPPLVAAAAPSGLSPAAPWSHGAPPPPHVQRAPPPLPLPATLLSAAYESAADMNPLKRKKLSSISSMLMSRDAPILRNVLAATGVADSSQAPPPPPPVSAPPSQSPVAAALIASPRHHRTLSDASNNDSEKFHRSDPSDEAHSPYTDRSFDEDHGSQSYRSSPPPQSYPADLRAGIAPYVPPQQKPEWKRYKQYTRTDIMSAIECVRNGMSALQASRKFGVPSRTLYDKVKKLGITTSRPVNRALKRETNGGAAYGGADELLDASFLQRALEGRGGGAEAGRGALHAMALAAAARAAASPPPDDEPAQDLSVARRRSPSPSPPRPPGAGVIVPAALHALHAAHVSAIIKKEDALRELRDDPRRALAQD